MRIRFIERDYWINKIKSNKTYITDQEVEATLPEGEYMDVTFIFTPHSNGFKTEILDNETNNSVTIDELNTAAYNFYIQQTHKLSMLQQLSKLELEDKAQKCISKIKDMISKWKDEKVVV